MEAMSFEEIILPHLDAAYNLARWLTRNPDDASDVVQEAMLRAFKYFSGFRGGDSRAWLLTIVRNTSYSWLGRQRSPVLEFRPEEDLEDQGEDHSDPAQAALQGDSRRRIHAALAELPIEFREVLVLHELDGLSYKEISEVAAIPIGTVMSRLSRGRERLKTSLGELRTPS
jgi:RNA polymerase sigma factor (sigma-70 family)